MPVVLKRQRRPMVGGEVSAVFYVVSGMLRTAQVRFSGDLTG
jgi:hypothetical protein